METTFFCSHCHKPYENEDYGGEDAGGELLCMKCWDMIGDELYATLARGEK